MQIPSKLQQIESLEKLPLLSFVIPAFEMFMTKWETLHNRNPNLAPFIEPGLAKAQQYYSKMDNTKAYVVAMGEFSISYVTPMADPPPH